MGGTNDVNNLIQLSVEEHALAHKKLWEEHGSQYDYIAWRAISGRIDNEQVIVEMAREFGKRYGAPKGTVPWNKGLKEGPDNNIRSGMKDKKHTPEAKEKQRQASMGNSGGNWTPERREKARQTALKQWKTK